MFERLSVILSYEVSEGDIDLMMRYENQASNDHVVPLRRRLSKYTADADYDESLVGPYIVFSVPYGHDTQERLEAIAEIIEDHLQRARRWA
jgi:hypothetical protein